MSAVNGHHVSREDQATVIRALYRQRREEGAGPLVIVDELRSVNETQFAPPLSDEELQHHVATALRGEADAAAVATALAAAAADEGQFRLTDQGNAERLVATHGDRLRFVTGLGWHAWDGRRFVRDTDGAAMRCMVTTVRAIYTEAAGTGDEEHRKALVKHATSSESEPRLRRAVTLAQYAETLVLSADDLDADPMLLNVANGVLDLRTSELAPHAPELACSKLAGADYHPSVVHPAWERFLHDLTGGDPEREAFLRRAAGCTLVGRADDEVLFFLHGPGATGKSTFLEALKAALGDYAVTADFETFVARRDTGSVRSDLARLVGRRMVTGIEVDEGQRLAEGVVKQLTGGDTITARFMYSDFFEYTPRFTLWLAANRRPRVDATDEAMWRRILQIPFTDVVPPERRDPSVKRTLIEDPDARAAVLAWAVRGCLEWQEQGLGVPVWVRAYTDEYRAENDPLAGWLADDCQLDAAAFSTTLELRASYETWARENGEQPIGSKRFAAALRGHGAHPEKGTGGVRGWRGVALGSGTCGTTAADPGNLPYAGAHKGFTESGATTATSATRPMEAACES